MPLVLDTAAEQVYIYSDATFSLQRLKPAPLWWLCLTFICSCSAGEVNKTNKRQKTKDDVKEKRTGKKKKKNTCTSCTYAYNCWVMWPESCGHHCSLQFACNHIACWKHIWHTLYPVPYLYSVKWLWVIEKHYVNIPYYHYNYTYIHLTRHAHIPVRTTLSKRSNSASLCILARVHKLSIIFYLLKYINSLFVATRLASPGVPEKQH